jgi:hypothetical protein
MIQRRSSRFTNVSIAALLTSAMAGCGSSGTTSTSNKKDAQADAARDAGNQPDAKSDAPNDAPSECPPGWTPEPGGGCTPPSVRRPFLVGASMRSASALERDDWLSTRTPGEVDVDPVTARALAAAWLQDALEEHASIAAFARFSLMLLAVGAPADLVTASQRASLDEIQHARACFDLAHRFGAEPRGPSALSLDGALAPLSLVELATLTAEEGLVGETLGAALAREQLAVARDAGVVRLLDKLVKDELRHAELAWRFTRWAVLQDPDAVAQAVERAIERALRSTLAMPIRHYDGVDPGAWHAHGRLTCAEAHRAAARAIEEVVQPCAARLLEVSSQPPRRSSGMRSCPPPG